MQDYFSIQESIKRIEYQLIEIKGNINTVIDYIADSELCEIKKQKDEKIDNG